MSKIFYTILIVLILISCHKEIEPPTRPIQPPFPEIRELKGSASRYIYLNPNGLDIKLTNDGNIVESIYRDQNLKYSTIFASCLLIGMGSVNDYKANISYYGYNNLISNEGVFFLYNNIKYSKQNWPINKGAPLDQNNNPRAYGDGMLWTSLSNNDSLKSLWNNNYLRNPIESMIINKAVYAYKSSELKNVIFIKYSIKNNNKKDWDNIQIGYFADNDVDILIDDYTYTGFAFANYLGFDSLRGVCYTYSDIMNKKFPILGYAFLDTPQNIQIKNHRLMYNIQNFQAIHGGEEQPPFSSTQQLFYVLNGLSITGTPMINPTTGLPTKFAFTGNPVTKKGWICTQPADVRSIITTEPFSLRSGETTWCNLAFVFETESEFANSYDKLLKKFDYIKSNRQLWDFK